jgi:hypothetical protein
MGKEARIGDEDEDACPGGDSACKWWPESPVGCLIGPGKMVADDGESGTTVSMAVSLSCGVVLVPATCSEGEGSRSFSREIGEGLNLGTSRLSPGEDKSSGCELV